MWLDGKWNGTSVGAISIEAGDDTTNKDDGKITFYTTQAGTQTRKMAIEQDGDVHIDTGNIVIGTSGKGIDFSATANSSGSMSNELLDDYEEGTFTPTWHSGFNGTYSTQEGSYTRIGNVVHVQGRINISNKGSNTSQLNIRGLPFGVSTSGVQYQMFQSSCIQGFDAGNNNDIFIQNQDGNNSTTLTVYNFGINDGDNYGGLTMSNAENNFQFNFRGTYRAN